MTGRKTRKVKEKVRLKNDSLSDFYSYINKNWQSRTELPPTETRLTQSYYIQQKINAEINTIIDAQHEGSPVADLKASWISEERGPRGLSPLLFLMLSMESRSDIVSRIGWMNRYGISPPLSIYIQGDPRDQDRCRVYIEEGEPNIGIPEYWDYSEHRKAYRRYIDSLATALGLPQLRKGYAAEHAFAHVYPIQTERRTRIHTMSWTELCNEFRIIDWTDLMTSYGLPKEQLAHLRYNITSSAFIHHLQHQIEDWPISRWQGWFALLVAQWYAGCSPLGPLRSVWFNYSRRFLRGALKDETATSLSHSIVRALMPNTMGKLWVKKHCHPSLKTAMIKMVNQIQAGAARLLGSTAWMSKATRTAAILKLKKMDIQICWPTEATWDVKELICGLSSTDFIANRLALSQLIADENIALIAKGGCRNPSEGGWAKPVFEVNAYYYPNENRFLLPAAILQPPFYDPAKSEIWNYGSIGATIGHEISHAFDSDGRSYDEHGDKHDWWTPTDTKEYKKKSQQMVRLYESQNYRGFSVDGELTLVENIADLGGLEFTLEGLKGALGRPATKAELREFFTSYAVSWRAKDRLKRASELLETNSHAPPKLRVNHIVQQMDAWYEAFDIGPDSPAWIAPERRIHFFG